MIKNHWSKEQSECLTTVYKIAAAKVSRGAALTFCQQLRDGLNTKEICNPWHVQLRAPESLFLNSIYLFSFGLYNIHGSVVCHI